MFNRKFGIFALLLCIVLTVGYFVTPAEAVSTVLLAVEGQITDANLVKFKGINGIGEDTGLAATNVVKSKFNATSAPTVHNDVDEDYTVGSRWLDVTNDKSYVCLDNSDGNAVWHLDVVGPGASTDHAIVRWDLTTGRTVLNSVVTISDAGVVAGGEWQGTVISPVYGGTGIANNVASTITISGNFATTITVTNVTAITLPTAGTLCVTTGTPETTFQIDDDNTGPKLKNSAGEMQIRNAADNAYANLRALAYYGDGSNLIGVGAAAASALTIEAKAAENIDKGEAVYISGATGQTPEVSLADNTNVTKCMIVGIAAETKTTGQPILIRVRGELTSLVTNGFVDGDVLYLSTAGAITKTEPTSGHIIIIGYCSYAHVSAGKIVILSHPTHGVSVPAATDVVIRMGDALGANKVIFKDYANAEVAYIDSDGGADFNSLILDTVLAIAEGGTNSGTALNNSRVMVSSAGAIIESATITVTELARLNGLAGIIVTDNNACTDIEGTLLSIGAGTLNVTIPEDHINATMLKDNNAPANLDIFTYVAAGTTGRWLSYAEIGIGVATSITDGLIVEADLDADAVAVGDILTYDDGGVDFLWKTKAELSIASSGANIDITSILNTALYVGRDTDNRISWAVDDTLTITIAGNTHSIVDIETGLGDNNSLVTQGYVDDIIAAGGATIELDNLGVVAINTSLISDTADTDDLGSALKEWRSIYVGTVGKIYLGLSQEISLEVTDANTLYITASANVSLSGGLIVAGTVALAANNITMTGSIAVTGSRVTKVWTVDIESTNAPTIGGAQIDSGDLSDVASIAMLDENEIVTVCWYFYDAVYQEYESDDAAGYPYWGFIRRRDGDPTYIVTTGDILGALVFSGARNEDPLNGAAAQVRAVADDTFAINDYPGRLEFLTVPDGDDTMTLRMAIDNAGNIKMGDGVWTDFIQVTAAGVMTAEGSATIAATTVASFTPAGGSLILAGADALTITTTAATGVTLPTSGTLLANISEDATPTVGGPFDLNEYAIDFSDDLGDDHDYSGITDIVTAGENVVFGQILYQKFADDEWYLALADAYVTAHGEVIALESKGNGQECLVLRMGYIRDDSAFDFGASAVFLNDDTGGACDDTAPAESGDQIQIVGTGMTADILYFNPSQDIGEI